MIEKIISSGVRLALLKKLILNPQSDFYLRQLSFELGYNVMTVREELKNLVSLDLVKSRSAGNRKYFQINPKHLLFPELKSLIVKTIGVIDVLKKHLLPLKHKINYSFIYGSIASGKETSESDIDLFIIGDVSPRELTSTIRHIGDEVGREVNSYIMKMGEFHKRLKAKDHFVISVIEKPKVFVVGDEEELKSLA